MGLHDIVPVLFALFVLVGLPFWIWMLVEAVKKEPNEGNEKLIWVVILVCTGFIGAILYFFIRRPQRITEHGS